MNTMARIFILCFLFCFPLFSDAAETAKVEFAPENSSAHFQATFLPQTHGSFDSPYSGQNSLSASSEFKTSFTSTLFLGHTLWNGGEIYFNPEMSGGEGLSQTKGIAGFPNAEIYRVDDAKPKFNLSRLYLKHTFGLGGDSEKIEGDLNQLAEQVDSNRLTLVAGKFALNDFFDNNQYSHDPRTQFFNWSLMDNGAWDYAADTRGYSWGFMVEYHQAQWAVRFASVLEPSVANQLTLDTNVLQAEGNNLEFEYHTQALGRPGAARLLTFLNRAHMGNYRETITTKADAFDITRSRAYRTKYGVGLNLEQELTDGLGAFLRAGWNDGNTETWAFTEIDETVSLGISLKGARWNRENDVFGLAFVMNGLSKDHLEYLTDGGYGFLIGDGKLRYAPEQILETYYSFQAFKSFAVSLDYQWIDHPGYNSDRGPASIYAARFHFEL